MIMIDPDDDDIDPADEAEMLTVSLGEWLSEEDCAAFDGLLEKEI
jgi:hypothetical protein